MSAVMKDVAAASAIGNTLVFDRSEAVEQARLLLAPSLDGRSAPAYPVEALGPLADACTAIAEHGQVQPAMAGQCLLGAASLLTQGLFNVQTQQGGHKPLSLYLATLGDSGDGKSTAQDAALRPVQEWQREASDTYRAELSEFESARLARKKGEDSPQPPAAPYRLMRDATVEGLRRDLDTGPCAQGVFTDEGAAILSGYGMSTDHRAKTAGVYSGLWDNGHLSASRASGGRVERYGRRVALHWLIQPAGAAEALGDTMLSALGFWPRFLAAWPESLPPRVHRLFDPGALPAVGRYWQRCVELLAMPLPDDATDCRVLPMADEARRLLGAAFERFEREARRGELREVKPFALRATEQACRVAGVLAAFAGSQQVSAQDAVSGLMLVSYSLETWRALIEQGAADQRGMHALRLYGWLTGRPGWREKLSIIVKDGPSIVRSKDKRDAALELLTELGLAQVAESVAVALMPESHP